MLDEYDKYVRRSNSEDQIKNMDKTRNYSLDKTNYNDFMSEVEKMDFLIYLYPWSSERKDGQLESFFIQFQ